MNFQTSMLFLLFSIIVFQVVVQITDGDIGFCSLHMYFYKTRAICEIPFYRELQLGRTTNCSKNFESLITCVKNVTRVCEHSWRSDEWIDMDVRLKFRKQFYCHDGALILPFALCGSEYFKEGPQCVRRFHRKFQNDLTDPSLCDEYSKAKECIQKLFNDKCPAKKGSESPLMKILFDGYNPFCLGKIYHPPTTATTPTRRRQRECKKVTRPSIKPTPHKRNLSSSSAYCDKLYFKLHVLILILLLGQFSVQCRE
ncbi:uncharacterized protein LOC111324610 [Stylophora pistillata]|uniref:uncharacterized protein LOC111324610 n=1 Tax=Stylophora pistillata TaxID=50429 RepID=UPI000C04B01A|nr:uncharacterized protein LOC111324610 [Stylophora pistillata]